MSDSVNLIFQLVTGGILLFFIVFLFFSYVEKEKFAVKRILTILIPVAIIFAASFLQVIPLVFELFFLVIVGFIILMLLIPFGKTTISFNIPEEKYDERNSMFSRMELKEGSHTFEEYYLNHPENKIKDDQFRNEPGLLNVKSKFYNPFLFESANATFTAVELLRPLVEGTPAKTQNHFNIQKQTAYIKKWAKKLGAHSVGITELKPYHIYSTGGRGTRYGKKIELTHRFAIAFTVEMDHDFVSAAPKGPIIMESSQQYLQAGNIAVQIAEFIRRLGFDARAHIDANYQVICPVVAQDAGLGVIGRMGLLMTPKLGPRVRIGVVTTDMKLLVTASVPDSSTIKFCEICKKCALNCPSQAIPFHAHPKKKKQIERWRVNHEACFIYWNIAGTDCGRCISVCPFSHPDNLVHNLIRWFIRQNEFNRRLALFMDNFFYGKKPNPKKPDSWMLPDFRIKTLSINR